MFGILGAPLEAALMGGAVCGDMKAIVFVPYGGLWPGIVFH
jgi:hypothetical protein